MGMVLDQVGNVGDCPISLDTLDGAADPGSGAGRGSMETAMALDEDDNNDSGLQKQLDLRSLFVDYLRRIQDNLDTLEDRSRRQEERSESLEQQLDRIETSNQEILIQLNHLTMAIESIHNTESNRQTPTSGMASHNNLTVLPSSVAGRAASHSPSQLSGPLGPAALSHHSQLVAQAAAAAAAAAAASGTSVGGQGSSSGSSNHHSRFTLALEKLQAEQQRNLTNANLNSARRSTNLHDHLHSPSNNLPPLSNNASPGSGYASLRKSTNNNHQTGSFNSGGGSSSRMRAGSPQPHNITSANLMSHHHHHHHQQQHHSQHHNHHQSSNHSPASMSPPGSINGHRLSAHHHRSSSAAAAAAAANSPAAILAASQFLSALASSSRPSSLSSLTNAAALASAAGAVNCSNHPNNNQNMRDSLNQNSNSPTNLTNIAKSSSALVIHNVHSSSSHNNNISNNNNSHHHNSTSSSSHLHTPSSASHLLNNPHYQTVRTKYSTRRYSRRRVGPEEAMADPSIRSTVALKMPVVPKTILIVLKHRLTVQTAITLACARTGEKLRKGAIQKKLEAMFREPGAVDSFLDEWNRSE